MTDSFTLVIFHQGQLEITKSIMSCCDPSLTWPPPNTSFVSKLSEIKCQPTLTFASIWKLLDVKLKQKWSFSKVFLQNMSVTEGG